MIGMPKRWLQLLVALVAMTGMVSPAWADDDAPAPRRVVEKQEVRICYREVPWAAKRVGSTGTKDAVPQRPWALATMDVRRPLSIGETDLQPGCYAWLCTHDEDGHAVLELTRLPLPEGALPDPEDVRPMTDRSLLRMPLEFDTSEGTSPHLTIELVPTKRGLRLKTRYGDGEAETTLVRR